MFEKKISGSVEGVVKEADGKAEIIKPPVQQQQVVAEEPQEHFPLGTKYLRDNRVWTVIRAFRDTSTDMRHVQSMMGEEELLTLKTLQTDMKSGSDNGTFAFVEQTAMDKLIARGRAAALNRNKK